MLALLLRGRGEAPQARKPGDGWTPGKVRGNGAFFSLLPLPLPLHTVQYLFPYCSPLVPLPSLQVPKGLARRPKPAPKTGCRLPFSRCSCEKSAGPAPCSDGAVTLGAVFVTLDLPNLCPGQRQSSGKGGRIAELSESAHSLLVSRAPKFKLDPA